MSRFQDTAYTNTKLNHIFSQNQLLLLVQLPFENPNQLEKIQALLAKDNLVFTKLSKIALRRQLDEIHTAFLPSSNANYIVTEKNFTETKSPKNLMSIVQMLKDYGALVLVAKWLDKTNGNAFWFDQSRLSSQAALAKELPFSLQLIDLVRTVNLLPLLQANVMFFVHFLNNKKNIN